MCPTVLADIVTPRSLFVSEKEVHFKKVKIKNHKTRVEEQEASWMTETLEVELAREQKITAKINI